MSIDPQRQIDTAMAFFLAGERCTLELAFGPYDLHVLSAPTIVNYAFSVELSLKLLHFFVSGEAMGGHSLYALFNSLPVDVKSRLPYLQDCAPDIDLYFVEWRYPFEHDFLAGEFDDPRRAFIECYREIRRQRPQLVSIYESDWGQFEPDWLNAWGENIPLEIRGKHKK